MFPNLNSVWNCSERAGKGKGARFNDRKQIEKVIQRDVGNGVQLEKEVEAVLNKIMNALKRCSRFRPFSMYTFLVDEHVQKNDGWDLNR